MCGRFALGVAAADLPGQFHQTALVGRGDAGELEALADGIYQTNIEGSEGHIHRVQLATTNLQTYYESYNVAPTNSALIIYGDSNKPEGVDTSYILESSIFGLIPPWAKPDDPTSVGKGGPSEGLPYSKELQRYSGRHFNCRKETLADNSPLWNSVKGKRCVVPIQGYFEWHKTKNDKIPHFVHSTTSPISYFAGFYSHNVNYVDNFNIEGKFLSSFTIVTAAALPTDLGDISWLHSRKPMFIKPGTKEWEDWLNPKLSWTDKLLDTCLNSVSNNAFADLEGYPVTKDVGKPGKKGPEILERQKASPQKSITSFFNGPKSSEGRKRARDDAFKEEFESREDPFKLKEEDKKPIFSYFKQRSEKESPRPIKTEDPVGRLSKSQVKKESPSPKKSKKADNSRSITSFFKKREEK